MKEIIKLIYLAGCAEEGEVRKRTRAPSLGPDLLDSQDEMDLDERNNPPKPSVPPGFLSPSVKQYLELGKSVPGEICTVIQALL